MHTIPFWGFSDRVSSWTHLLSAVAAAVGGFYLFTKGRGNGLRLTALSVYTWSLVFLYAMSGVFHLLEQNGDAREVMQRLDYAGIWVLIAGTFTPLHIILFRGAWRWLILLIVWTVAITSLVLEVIFFKSIPEWLTLTLFLSLGWMGALTGYKFRKAFKDESIQFLAWGGLAYSVGAVIDFLKGPILWPGVIGPHEIFHIFVIIGSALHWRFVYLWSHHPVEDTIVFHVSVLPHRMIARAANEHICVEAETVEELKDLIKHQVQAKFHDSHTPKIHLKYFHEEIY